MAKRNEDRDPFANPPVAAGAVRDFEFDANNGANFDGWTDVNHYYHKQVVKTNHWHSFGDGDVINHNHDGPTHHTHRLVLATPDSTVTPAPRRLSTRESNALILREEALNRGQ